MLVRHEDRPYLSSAQWRGPSVGDNMDRIGAAGAQLACAYGALLTHGRREHTGRLCRPQESLHPEACWKARLR